MRKFSGGAVTVEVSCSCSFSPSSVKSPLTRAFCWSATTKAEVMTSHYLIPLSLLLSSNTLAVEPSRRFPPPSLAQAADYLPTELDDAKHIVHMSVPAHRSTVVRRGLCSSPHLSVGCWVREVAAAHVDQLQKYVCTWLGPASPVVPSSTTAACPL